ncbi:MAG: glycosyltransferase family 2 protein [Desulfatiglandaceae bacterium]
MKLIIQIPCYNEEETLPVTLADLPREVKGFDTVEWLIVDDGSTDNTVQVAKDNGVDHIVRLNTNRGLATAFMAGLEGGLKRGADVIVNTDADNQYNGADIPKLTAPIISKNAGMVLGARPISEIEHFSWIKKTLQKLGSWVVRLASGSDVPDAPSGFRALSREAALRMNVFNKHTYTLETIIQAGQTGIRVVSVDIGVNEDLRPSRLVKSIPSYVYRSFATIFRIFVLYRPFRFFASIGLGFIFVAFLIGLRFLCYYYTGNGAGHIQSLILAAILSGLGGMGIATAFLADLMAANRRLLEDLQFRIRKQEYRDEHSAGKNA